MNCFPIQFFDCESCGNRFALCDLKTLRSYLPVRPDGEQTQCPECFEREIIEHTGILADELLETYRAGKLQFFKSALYNSGCGG